MRAALIAPRPAVVAASWSAVERVLYLVALRACLRPTADDSAAVRTAWRALDATIAHGWLAHVEAAPVGGAQTRQWITAAQVVARAEVAALDLGRGLAVDVTARAAVLVWAAVAAWSDAPTTRWDTLTTQATALADALDAVVDGSDALDAGTSALATGAAAARVRERMADVWREMEAGR